MDRQCVICDSKAIVTQEAAKGIALMISLGDSTWSKVQEAKDRAIREGRDLLVVCLAAMAQNCCGSKCSRGCRQTPLRGFLLPLPALWCAVRGCSDV
jgi:hypothetical protein